MKTRLFLLLLLAASSLPGQTAKLTTESSATWLGWFNQSRLSNRWGLWAEGQVRTQEQLIGDLGTALVRLGATYYAGDQTKLTAGYAYVHFFAADNHPNTYLPEHRPWQQLQWHTRYGRWRMMNWLRLEERYRRRLDSAGELGQGYDFNFRARANFLFLYPLRSAGPQPGSLSVVLSNEVMVNFGKKVVLNYFDQNRFFAGLAFHTNAHDNLQFGYMNLFQQLGSGNRYRNLHTLRIFYFHNLDLRKTK